MIGRMMLVLLSLMMVFVEDLTLFHRNRKIHSQTWRTKQRSKENASEHVGADTYCLGPDPFRSIGVEVRVVKHLSTNLSH